MDHDDLWLNDLAEAILDGTPATDLDSGGTDVNDSHRAAIRQAQILARIAEVHRTLPWEPDSALVPDDTAPLVSWGRLTIVAEIGRGTFGVVYRARDSRLDRDVALKLERPRAGLDSGRLAVSVLEEGRVLARVHHSNVVAIYDADRIAGRVGLTMEFVRGRTLEQMLRDGGPFSPDEVIASGTDVCRALAAVHDAGLLHRDIKAQNVMQEDGGRLVLMDFGAGRELRELVDEPRDVPPDLAGTPLYLAPEIFEGKPATVSSDIYSVSVLLFHLLTGTYPVSGRTIQQVREGHSRHRRVLLSEARADIPDALARAIERGCAANPADRYASAHQMAAALASAVTPVPPAWRLSSLAAWTGLIGGLVALATAVGGLTVGEWRDQLLPRLGKPGQPAGAREQAGAAAPSFAVRQVLLPGEYAELGKPSLDGRYFPFVDTNSDLAIRELATGRIRQLTGRGQSTEYVDGSATISPDSHWIAFPWVTSDRAFELRVLALDGSPNVIGQPRALLRRSDVEAYPIEWSGDGTEILSVFERQDLTAQLALIAVADGSASLLKDLGGMRPQGVSLSPDGRFVVYDRPQQDNPRVRDIFMLATDGSGEWPLVEHPANDLFPQWSPDGERVFFASDRTGALGLWTVRVVDGRALGEPEVISADMGRMNPLGLTRSGAFYYHVRTGLVDVYTIDMDPTSGASVGKPRPVSPNYIGSNISSGWSPDGRRLTYVSIRSVARADRFSRTLSIRDRETGKEHDLWPALAFFIMPQWSPDGRSVLVRGNDLNARCCLHQIDVETGRVTHIPLADPTNTGHYQWLGNGKAFVYARAQTILSRDLATGTETELADIRAWGVDRLTPPPQGRPFEISPDGHSLAFTGWIGAGQRAQTVLDVLPLGGTAVEIARSSSKEPMFFQGWTSDGRELLFTRPTSTNPAVAALWRIPVWGGAPLPVGLEMLGLRDVHISPDGTHLTFTAGWETGEVRVMENFLPR